MTYKPFPEIFGDIVSVVRNRYTMEKIIPYYDYGSPLEVVNRLKVKASHPEFTNCRYPLVWLLIDGSVKEEVVMERRLVKDITIVICNNTESKFSSPERYANNFVPVLRPVYDALMYGIKNSTLVSSHDNYKHFYFENLFWGSEGTFGNIADDKLDAIIINGLNLKLNEVCHY